MEKLTVSLGQMNIALGDERKNWQTMEAMMKNAARLRSHLVVFPELWSTGYDLENAKEHASEISKGAFAQLSKMATQYKIAHAGSILEKRGMEVTNSAPLFAPNGRMVGIYRKLHLFGLMEEDQYLAPGAAGLTMDLPWGTTGMAICYDLRFPELFRRYATQDGARLIVVPAEWPLERIDHWRALLVARAIENQAYIIATNAAGKTGDTVFGGHSMVIDPWGKIMVEAGETSQLLTVELDLTLVDTVRKRIPVFDDMRLDIYG
jgi:omega-amidase